MTPISALSRDLVVRACGEGCNFPECACSRSPLDKSPIDVWAFFADRVAEDRATHERRREAFQRHRAEYFAGGMVW